VPAAGQCQPALNTIIEIANNKRAAPSTRLAAANAILDRAHGRPTSSVELSGEGGKSLKQEFFHDGMSKEQRLIVSARLVGNLLENGRKALEAEKRAEADKLIEGTVETSDIK